MKDAFIPYSIIDAFRQIDNIYECRLFGWLIAKAQSVLKLYNKDLGEINLQYAMNLVTFTIPARYLLNAGDNNYRNIIKAFTLASKTIDYESDDVNMRLNIIAFPSMMKENGKLVVSCVIHNEMWHALLNFSKGYRLVSLQTYMRLSSKYSIVFLILISQQTTPMKYSVGYLRRLTGTEEKKAYDRTANFFAKVIDPARRELNRESPITFEYTADRSGLGGRYYDVTIIPKKNQDYRPRPADEEHNKTIERQRVRLDERVTEYLMNNFGMRPRDCENIENMLADVGNWDDQIVLLEKVRHVAAARGVRSPAGYLVETLKNRK